MTAYRHELGDDFYVFTSSSAGKSAQELLISAHGGHWGPFTSTFWVPEWTSLCFYGEHGHSLSDPGVNSFSFSGRFDPVEKVLPGGACLNYALTKYQGSHNKAKGSQKETYATLMDAIVENRELAERNDKSLSANNRNRMGRERAQKSIGKGEDAAFDVLTVRNRFRRVGGASLLSVIIALGYRRWRYSRIHCSFCRGWGKAQDANPKMADEDY